MRARRGARVGFGAQPRLSSRQFAPSVGANQEDELAPEVRFEGTEIELGVTFIAE